MDDDTAKDISLALPFTRRQLLLAAGAGWCVYSAPLWALERATLDAALRAYTGTAAVTEGRVRFEIAPLVENGNTGGLQGVRVLDTSAVRLKPRDNQHRIL